jgi:hypothetical protein
MAHVDSLIKTNHAPLQKFQLATKIFHAVSAFMKERPGAPDTRSIKYSLQFSRATLKLKIMQVSLDPIGLCRNCSNARVINNARGSAFYLCELAGTNPRFPKYPRLPVLRCEGYRPISAHQAFEENSSKPEE